MKRPLEEYFSKSNAIEGVYGEQPIKESIDGWEYLSTKNEITHEHVQTAHNHILKNRQPDIAGEYRTVNVRVGNDTPPKPSIIQDLLNTLYGRTPETAIEALEWHIRFEKIHPFADGNGRIGRMIYLWHCEKIGVEPIVWSDEERQSYYSLFNSYPHPSKWDEENHL